MPRDRGPGDDGAPGPSAKQPTNPAGAAPPQAAGPGLAPALVLPFRLRGHEGRVTVAYGVNRDPARWGFGLFDLPFDPALVVGFPVCAARVDYPGEGYLAAMGWVQVVTVEPAGEPAWAAIDVAPMHWGVDTPFAVFGSSPAFFDAPGPNPPRADERWTADAFLAVCPDGLRSRRVEPVVGFRWGYDLRGARAAPFPPQPAAADDWRRCRATRQAAHPTWGFGASFPR